MLNRVTLWFSKRVKRMSKKLVLLITKHNSNFILNIPCYLPENYSYINSLVYFSLIPNQGEKMIIKWFALLLLVPICFAGIVSQTDWSGGDGVTGPVIDWSNQFSVSQNSNFYNLPGEISLELKKNIISQNLTSTRSICSVDIDGDGDKDMVVSGSNPDIIAWIENNNGIGTSWTEHIVDSLNLVPVRSIYSIDIDNDNDMDILHVTDYVSWYENCDGSGTSWTSHLITYGFAGGISAYSKDINGDGDMDVIGAAMTDDDITWWRNDGYGTNWTEYFIDLNFDGAYSVYSEDIDGDGDFDVLGASNRSAGITWWANADGYGYSWTEHIVDGSFTGCNSIYSEDIDDDGDLDVLGAGYHTDTIAWWDNSDGSGITWVKHVIDDNFDGAYSICSEDIDTDGDIDVLGVAHKDDDITWWENTDGYGTSWIEHTIYGDLVNARSIFLEDLDNDSDMDVLGAGSYTIAWWDIFTYSAEASLESSILNIQEPVSWQEINWTSNEPTGTLIGFNIRSSNDSNDMGEWSDILYSPTNLSTILTDGDSLFQYKVFLSTTDSTVTPTLNDVSITWAPYTATEEKMELKLEGYAFNGAQPNPTFGNINISFVLPSDSRATLTIFDIAGRIVNQSSAYYPVGPNQEVFTNLMPGVYQIRMTANEFTAIKQFVVNE